MKKKRITYGVSGMMEYQCLIRFGKNTLKVTFTGGSMNAIGITPATFTTTDFLIQQAIENSNEFKRGRITVVNAAELNEEVCIERSGSAPMSAAAVCEHEASGLPATAEGDGREERTESNNSGVQAKAEEKEEPAPPMAQVEFSCNDDAKDYLEQTFGFIRSKLRNREDIINAGKIHNMDIIFV